MSNSKLRFGLATPSNFWRLDLANKQTTLAEIARQGFDHIFLADHVSFRNGSGTDGFVEVAGLSQLHDTLGVMISIYLLPLRHPLPVARQLVTMDQLAPGRLVFGVGIGGEDRHETEVCGVDPRTRGKRTNESLAIIRRLLSGETVDFDGEHFQLEQARIQPQPKHDIPFIVGGRSDAALTRVAKYGDGWVGVWCSTKRYEEAVASIQQQADALGRGTTPWLHAYQPWVGLAADETTARKHVAEQMEAFYKIPFEKFERYTPFGTPKHVAEQLAPYKHAGCQLFNLKVCASSGEEEVSLGSELIKYLSEV